MKNQYFRVLTRLAFEMAKLFPEEIAETGVITPLSTPFAVVMPRSRPTRTGIERTNHGPQRGGY